VDRIGAVSDGVDLPPGVKGHRFGGDRRRRRVRLYVGAATDGGSDSGNLVDSEDAGVAHAGHVSGREVAARIEANLVIGRDQRAWLAVIDLTAFQRRLLRALNRRPSDKAIGSAVGTH